MPLLQLPASAEPTLDNVMHHAMTEKPMKVYFVTTFSRERKTSPYQNRIYYEK
jgi:hypothetical protein